MSAIKKESVCAWIDETDGMYRDLLTGKRRKDSGIRMEGHGFCWLRREWRQGAGSFVSEKNGVADDPFGFSMVEDWEKLTKNLLQII